MDDHARAFYGRQPLPHLVVGVQIVSLHQYALHLISNVHDRFQSCTLGVQATPMIYNNPKAYLAVCVQCRFPPMHLIADNHYPTLCRCTNRIFAPA